jgi:hypothetical protein
MINLIFFTSANLSSDRQVRRAGESFFHSLLSLHFQSLISGMS